LSAIASNKSFQDFNTFPWLWGIGPLVSKTSSRTPGNGHPGGQSWSILSTEQPPVRGTRNEGHQERIHEALSIIGEPSRCSRTGGKNKASLKEADIKGVRGYIWDKKTELKKSMTQAKNSKMRRSWSTLQQGTQIVSCVGNVQTRKQPRGASNWSHERPPNHENKYQGARLKQEK